MKMAIIIATLGSVVSLAAIARAAQTASASASAIPSWGEAVNGLQLSIARDPTTDDSNGMKRLKVSFRDVGPENEIIVTGGGGCGIQYDATSDVSFDLVDEKGNQHRRLPYWGDGPPYKGGYCAGVIGPVYSATLHPGESVSMLILLEKYFDFSDSKAYTMFRFHPGKYSLQAELYHPRGVASPGADKFWFGTVKSNILQVQFDSEFAAPLGDVSR